MYFRQKFFELTTSDRRENCCGIKSLFFSSKYKLRVRSFGFYLDPWSKITQIMHRRIHSGHRFIGFSLPPAFFFCHARFYLWSVGTMRAHAKASAERETRKKIDVSQATPCWVFSLRVPWSRRTQDKTDCCGLATSRAPEMHHHPSDLGSPIQILTLAKERTLNSRTYWVRILNVVSSNWA